MSKLGIATPKSKNALNPAETLRVLVKWLQTLTPAEPVPLVKLLQELEPVAYDLDKQQEELEELLTEVGENRLTRQLPMHERVKNARAYFVSQDEEKREAEEKADELEDLRNNGGDPEEGYRAFSSALGGYYEPGGESLPLWDWLDDRTRRAFEAFAKDAVG